MKIVYNIYVAVRKLWNAIFGKNGDGSQLVIPGRISGASGDVTIGDGLNLTSDVLKSTVPVVSANPETGESDPELTGLMIGSNKYKVPSGGGGEKYYSHNIELKQSGSNNTLIYIVLMNKSNVTFTIESIYSYLDGNGFNSPDNVLQATGRFNSTATMMGIYKSSTTNHFGVWAIGSETADITLIVGHDIVIEI